MKGKGGENKGQGREGGKESRRRRQEEKPSTKYEVEIRRNSVAQGGEGAGTVVRGGAVRACVADEPEVGNKHEAQKYAERV